MHCKSFIFLWTHFTCSSNACLLVVANAHSLQGYLTLQSSYHHQLDVIEYIHWSDGHLWASAPGRFHQRRSARGRRPRCWAHPGPASAPTPQTPYATAAGSGRWPPGSSAPTARWTCTRIIGIIFLNAISSCLLSTNSTTTMERVDTTAVFYLCCVTLHLAVVFPTNFSLIHSNLVLLEPPAAASLGWKRS